MDSVIEMKQKQWFSLRSKRLFLITSSTFTLTCAFALRGLVNFGIRFMGASFLEIDDYGVLIILLTIINTSYFFIDANLDRSAMKFIPERKEKNQEHQDLISAYIKGSLFFGSLLTLIICVFIFLFLFPRINLVIFLILIAFFPLSALFKTIMGIFHGEGKANTRALFEIFYIVIIGIFLSALIIYGFELNAVIFGFVIGIIASLISAFYLLNRRFHISFSTNMLSYKKEIYFGFGMTIATLGGALLLSIDVYMLTFLRGYTSVGLYSIAYTIGLIAVIPVVAFSQVLIPIFAQTLIKENSLEKEKKLYAQMMLITLILSSIFCIILFYSLDFILNFFFNSKNAALKQTTQILLIGMFIFNICSYNFSYMLAKGVIKSIISLTWFQVFIFIFLNWILITNYDVIGASIAFTLSYCVAFIITEYYIIKSCLGK